MAETRAASPAAHVSTIEKADVPPQPKLLIPRRKNSGWLPGGNLPAAVPVNPVFRRPQGVTYTPSLITTARGALDTSPVADQVMPWPVRPS